VQLDQSNRPTNMLSAAPRLAARPRHAPQASAVAVACSSASGGGGVPAAVVERRRRPVAAAAAASTSRRAAALGLPLLLLGVPAAGALELAPLGPVRGVGGAKRVGQTAAQVAEVLAADLAERQYFVTGNLTPEIFADDCRRALFLRPPPAPPPARPPPPPQTHMHSHPLRRKTRSFVDPTNTTVGLSRYIAALALLFDPETSFVKLLSIEPTGPRTVEATFQLGGYLRFPWHPRIEPVTGARAGWV